MLTWQDCVGLSDLTEEEIDAVAEHEHLPHLAALALAEYLVHCPDGCLRVKRMILDDIEAARQRHDHLHVLKLRLALQAVTRDKATVIIAQRLGSLMHADEIIVLDNGCIVERGRHEDLLRTGGLYARLYALQSRAGASDEAPADRDSQGELA